jgi:hypothetical protein
LPGLCIGVYGLGDWVAAARWARTRLRSVSIKADSNRLCGFGTHCNLGCVYVRWSMSFMSVGKIFKKWLLTGLLLGFIFSITSLVLTFVGVRPFSEERGIAFVPLGFLLPNFICLLGAGIYAGLKKFIHNNLLLSAFVTNLPATVFAIYGLPNSYDPLRIMIVWILCFICCGMACISVRVSNDNG